MEESLTASSRLCVGVMTGTSIDGIDAALVNVEGRGLTMRAQLLRHVSRSLGGLGSPLRTAAQQQPISAGQFAKLAWEFGELHAQVIEALIDSHASLDLICVHGQTLFHQPPLSLQLVNPALIAQRFNCPVVFDLRQADLAAGGQGAPITPLADWILFRQADKSRAIINLGGFCNVTILPASGDGPRAIAGFDVCACNQLLDAIAQTALNQRYDEGGRAALAGRADDLAARRLLDTLNHQRSQRRSLGTGDEALAWLKNHASRVKANDLAASGVGAIATCVAEALKPHAVDEIILAGGGARNRALIQAIAKHAQTPVQLSDSVGVPINARESIAFAILGALCADGVPITLPQVTGCTSPAPISGSWCRLQLSTLPFHLKR